MQTKERLAIRLGLPIAELELYLAGEKPLPNQAYIRALDIVANGHLNEYPK
jgi:hypothetical protein